MGNNSSHQPSSRSDDEEKRKNKYVQYVTSDVSLCIKCKETKKTGCECECDNCKERISKCVPSDFWMISYGLVGGIRISVRHKTVVCCNEVVRIPSLQGTRKISSG